MDLKLDIYNPLDTLESVEKFWGISDIFDVFMTSSMSNIYVICSFGLQQVSQSVQKLLIFNWIACFDKIDHPAKFNV